MSRSTRFDWTALAILSRREVPQLARDEALARAAAGENINKQLAEEIVDSYREPPDTEPDREAIAKRLVDQLSRMLDKFHGKKTR